MLLAALDPADLNSVEDSPYNAWGRSWATLTWQSAAAHKQARQWAQQHALQAQQQVQQAQQQVQQAQQQVQQAEQQLGAGPALPQM